MVVWWVEWMVALKVEKKDDEMESRKVLQSVQMMELQRVVL